jgi:hypothetical protein
MEVSARICMDGRAPSARGLAGGKRCSRCKAVRFCRDACAAAAWPAHKAACSAAAAAQQQT